MPTKIEVGGHLATVHATLHDPERVMTDGETTIVVVGNFNEIFDRGDDDRDPEELRAALERELTDQARRLRESDASARRGGEGRNPAAPSGGLTALGCVGGLTRPQLACSGAGLWKRK